MTLHREGYGLIALAVALGTGMVALGWGLGAPQWVFWLLCALAAVDGSFNFSVLYRLAKRGPAAKRHFAAIVGSARTDSASWAKQWCG